MFLLLLEFEYEEQWFAQLGWLMKASREHNTNSNIFLVVKIRKYISDKKRSKINPNRINFPSHSLNIETDRPTKPKKMSVENKLCHYFTGNSIFALFKILFIECSLVISKYRN